MRNILTSVLLFLLISSLYSNNEDDIIKARKAYSRYIEYAHPSPIKVKSYNEIPEFLLDKSDIRFKDISTTVSEINFAQKMQNESSIAVNPKNPKNLIASAVDYRDNSSTWVYVSHDGGLSWENINLGKPFTYWRSTNDPSVAYNSDGVAFLNYGGFQTQPNLNGEENGENAVFVARSFDEGKTWEAHIPVIIHLGLQTLDSNFEDKYYIEIDNSPESPYFGDIYIPWKRVTARDSATQIVVSKSTDNGSTWSDPIGISHRLSGSSEDTTFGQSFPLATTSPEGYVYVCWNHGIEHGVGFVKSLDGGLTYSEPRIIHNYEIFGETRLLAGQGYRHTVKGGVRAEAYPSMQCDFSENSPGKGNIYLSWSADNPPNVYFSKSTNQGDTWTEPVIVHSETKNDQFWQWLEIDPITGDLAIMYLDSRDDPDNIMVDCYVSYSSDQGETWIDRKASSEQSDLRLNPFTGNAFAGDYSGIAFHDGIIYPSWVDMRNAGEDITDSDVYTSIVNINAPNPVENFAAEVIPEDPTKLNISWVAPTETTFGKKLNMEDFSYKLYRNEEFVNEFSSNILLFEDKQLIPYTDYNYAIKVHSAKDSSILVELKATSGGSIAPGLPSIAEFQTEYSNQNEIKFGVKIPDTRADGNTILVGLNKLYLEVIYKDSFMIRQSEIDLNDEDRGQIIDISEILFSPELLQKGYYTLKAKVSSELSGITANSEELVFDFYFGEKQYELFDSFDDNELARYLIKGNWQLTDEFSFSGGKSLTESPLANYKTSHSDTLTLFPVYLKADEKAELSFYIAGLMHSSDPLIIQYSFDNGSWQDLISIRNLDFEPWKDNIKNDDDWKFEQFNINNPNNSESKLQIRFAFVSNALLTGDGCYLEDIQINSVASSVKNSSNIQTMLYPNPAKDKISIITNSKLINKIEIFDILGNRLLHLDNISVDNQYQINLSQLKQGTYFIKYQFQGEVIFDKFVKIN